MSKETMKFENVKKFSFDKVPENGEIEYQSVVVYTTTDDNFIHFCVKQKQGECNYYCMYDVRLTHDQIRNIFLNHCMDDWGYTRTISLDDSNCKVLYANGLAYDGSNIIDGGDNCVIAYSDDFGAHNPGLEFRVEFYGIDGIADEATSNRIRSAVDILSMNEDFEACMTCLEIDIQDAGEMIKYAASLIGIKRFSSGKNSITVVSGDDTTCLVIEQPDANEEYYNNMVKVYLDNDIIKTSWASKDDEVLTTDNNKCKVISASGADYYEEDTITKLVRVALEDMWYYTDDIKRGEQFRLSVEIMFDPDDGYDWDSDASFDERHNKFDLAEASFLIEDDGSVNIVKSAFEYAASQVQ